MGTQDPLTGGGHLLQETPGLTGAPGTVDDEVAEADAPHVTGLEVVDPRLQGGVEGLRVALGGQAAVAQPHGGVLHRVLELALKDPGVEPLGEPGGHGVAPRAGATMLPVAEHDRARPGFEVLAEPGDERRQDGAAGVAVLHEGQAGLAYRRRSEDEGRVGGDEVEAAAGHRLQEGAVQELQAAHARGCVGSGGGAGAGGDVESAQSSWGAGDAHAGQGRVEGGEGQGAHGDVGGHHVLGVTQQVEGLDAAAAAQVQGGAHGRARGQARQGEAGAADTQDVIGGQGPAGDELAQVGGHPPADLTGVVNGLVGAQVDQGTDAAGLVRLTDQADGGGARRCRAGQGGVQGGGGDRLTEHEQGGQDGHGRGDGPGGQGGAHGSQGGQADLAAQGGVGDLAQEGGHRLHAPAGVCQVRPQARRLLGRGRRGREGGGLRGGPGARRAHGTDRNAGRRSSPEPRRTGGRRGAQDSPPAHRRRAASSAYWWVLTSTSSI